MCAARWLGLDFGTSSVKALLVARRRGRGGPRLRVPTPRAAAPGGVAEQDAADYLAPRGRRSRAVRCRTACPRAGSASPARRRRSCSVDEDGEAVRPALTWQDHRADAEARDARRRARPSRAALRHRACPGPPPYPPAKLLWLSRHEPETVARTRFVLQPKDYVGLQLTGSPLSDPWSSKGLCHVRTFEPATRVLERVGFAPRWRRRSPTPGSAAASSPRGSRRPSAFRGGAGLGRLERRRRRDARRRRVRGPAAFVLVRDLEHRRDHHRPSDLPAAPAPARASRRPARPSPSTTARPSRAAPRSSGSPGSCAASRPRCSARRRLRSMRGAPVFVPYLSGERAPVWRTDVRARRRSGSAPSTGRPSSRAPSSTGVCLSEADVLAVAEEHAGLGAGVGRCRRAAARPSRPGAKPGSRRSGRPSTCSTSRTPRRSARRCSARPPRRATLDAARPLRRGLRTRLAERRFRPPTTRLAPSGRLRRRASSWQDDDVCSSQQ